MFNRYMTWVWSSISLTSVVLLLVYGISPITAIGMLTGMTIGLMVTICAFFSKESNSNK